MSNLIKYITTEERAKLLRLVHKDGSKREKVVMEVLATYGLRASEVGLLRCRDFCPERGVLRIRRLKNGIDNELPLLDSVAAAIVGYRKSLGRVVEGPDSPLIPGRSATKGLSRSTVFRIVKKFTTKLGLPKDMRHPHILRHSVATSLLERGMDVMDVKGALGHKSLSSTLRYAQVTPFRLKAAFEAAKLL